MYKVFCLLILSYSSYVVAGNLFPKPRRETSGTSQSAQVSPVSVQPPIRQIPAQGPVPVWNDFLASPYSSPENRLQLAENIPQDFKESIDLTELVKLKRQDDFWGVTRFFGIVEKPFAVILSHDCKKVDPTQKDLSFDDKVYIAQRVAQKLSHFHESSIFYRGVRAEHIISSVSMGYCTVNLLHPIYTYLKNSLMSWQGQTDGLAWTAPELLISQKFSAATDMWAFGMTLIELWTRQTPYGDLSEDAVRLKIESGELPEIPADAPDWYQELILRCLKINPSERISAKDAANILAGHVHPWYQHFISVQSMGDGKTTTHVILDELPDLKADHAEKLNQTLSRDDWGTEYHHHLSAYSPVIKYLGVQKEPFAIVTESFRGTALSECKELEFEQKLDVIAGLAQALVFLHNFKHTYHGLIQAAHVFYDGKKTKLSSHVLARMQMEFGNRSAYHAWEAPEVLAGAEHSPASDMWSFAVTLIEIFTGRMPEARDQAVIIPSDFPEVFKDLIEKCLIEDPTKRMLASQAARLLLDYKNKDKDVSNDEQKNTYRFFISYKEISRFPGQDRQRFKRYVPAQQNMYLRMMGEKEVFLYRLWGSYEKLRDWRFFRSEINFLRAYPHENILSIIGISNHHVVGLDSDDGEAGFVTEPFAGKAITEQSLSEADKLKIAKDVARALSFLHDKNFNNKVRLANILYDGTKAVIVPSVIETVSDAIIRQLEDTGEEGKSDDRYLAPEQRCDFRGEKNENFSDMWHFGMFLYKLFAPEKFSEFFTKEDNNKHETSYIEKAKRGDLGLPDSLPENIKAIISGCLKHNGKERLSIKEVLALLGG